MFDKLKAFFLAVYMKLCYRECKFKTLYKAALTKSSSTTMNKDSD